MYQCPLCLQPLTLDDRSYRCDTNHQFDVAKEGYVNLMPAHHKRSKDPGDNKQMMQARRRFLEGHHYQPMREQVAQLLRASLATESRAVLDIGCGEGYYTAQIHQTLSEKHPQLRTFGLDISKTAIRSAAKRYPQCEFSVASSHRLPFADQSLDAIVRIYAPCKAPELSRCLNTHGVVITVTPAARHLYQLREQIYSSVRLHDETPEKLDGFELETEQHLHYPMELNNGAAFDLLQMTPFAWKASDALREQLQTAIDFHCEADFMLRVYRKKIG